MNRVVHVVSLILFVAGFAFADDTYPIKFERSAKKGDKFVVAGSATHIQAQKQTVAGTPQENKSYGSMTFEGEVEVLEVADDGKVTKATCVVHACSMTSEEGGEAMEPIAESTVLSQEIKDDQKVVTSDKGELAPEVVDLLNEFLPCDTKDKGPDLDATFGVAEPKKVGDSWPVNAEAVAAGLGQEMQTKIDAGKVKGTVKLAEVSDHEGTNCMIFHVELQIGEVVPPGMEGAEVKKAEMSLKLGVALPVDASLASVAENMDMTYECAATVKDPKGNAVELEITVHNSKEVEHHAAK